MARVHLVDFLVILFGIGTWVAVNSVWVSLPLLVQDLPEKWNLPSYLSVIIQIANLGPIAYTVLNSFFPKIVTEKRAIYTSMTVEALAALMMGFFWRRTAFVFGDERSIGLFVLAFVLALVDCSSRVLFLPFMTRFKPAYLMPYFIGEGLSSFIPSIFSLIQGVGGNPECQNVTRNGTDVIEAVTGDPLFSVSTFFYIVFGIMVISVGAFHLLNFNSIVKNAIAQTQVAGTTAEHLNSPERRDSRDYKSTSPVGSIKLKSSESLNIFEIDKDNNVTKIGNPEFDNSSNSPAQHIDGEEKLFSHVSKQLFISLLIIQGLTCAMSNGVFPSIQSYSCLPYGNVVYHLAVSLSSMTNPIVCFIAMALPKPTQMSIISAGVLSVGVASYAFTTALESPEPPLVGQVSGEVLLVATWIVLIGLFTYVRVSIATILRQEGRRGLFLCGAFTQIGSAIGALVTFFVVNYTDTFQSYEACQSDTTYA